MYKQKLGFIALTLLLACTQAIAGDPAPAAKDAHAAPAKESPKDAVLAKDAHVAEPKEAVKGAAKDAKEVKEVSKEVAPAKDAHAGKTSHSAPAKDAHAADAKDNHAAATKEEQSAAAQDSPAANEGAKAVARKPKRKKAKPEAKAQAKGHGDVKVSADHPADAAPPVPAAIAPTTRVRTRDRAAAASAVAAEQSAGAQDGHGDSHAATLASSDAHRADTQASPTTGAKQEAHGSPAADAHHADAAPSVPANIEPTQRQRVKPPVAAMPAPTVPAAPAAHADTAVHDDHSAADAHGKPASAASDGKHAAKDSGGHDAHHDAKHDGKSAPRAHDTHASTLHGGDECNLPLKAEIAALFDRWNASLRTGDPKKVVANYAPDSVLLPTVSNRARFTIAEKEDYFMHFLQRRPQGYIDDRMIEVDCNSATDAGLYTFRFADGGSVKARYSFSYKKINGQWLITSHHSSGMPEKPQSPPAAHVDTHAAPASDSGGSTKGWVRFP